MKIAKNFYLKAIIALLFPTFLASAIAYKQLTFYAFTQKFTLEQHEILLLFVSLAPFLYLLPASESRYLCVLRKIYWILFFILVGVYGFGLLILLLINPS